MENFMIPIEWKGQIVITTAQLAKVYGATTDNIKDNFNGNKDRFTEGKHYILLTGQALREFKNQVAESNLVAKNTSQLYLWTRRGASRHCKILGTDKAWEQFDYLEDNYFDKKPQSIPLTTAQQIQLLAQGNVELNQRVDTLTDRMDKFEQDLPLLPANADELSATVKKRVVEVLGGKHSNAYHDKSISQTAFLDAYRNLKRNFDVRTYKNIKRCQMDIALQIAKEYQPPAFLKELIRNCNA